MRHNEQIPSMMHENDGNTCWWPSKISIKHSLNDSPFIDTTQNEGWILNSVYINTKNLRYISMKRILCDPCHIGVKIRIIIGCHGRSTTGCSSSIQILHLLRILLRKSEHGENNAAFKIIKRKTHRFQWWILDPGFMRLMYVWCIVVCSRRAPQLLFLLERSCCCQTRSAVTRALSARAAAATRD